MERHARDAFRVSKRPKSGKKRVCLWRKKYAFRVSFSPPFGISSTEAKFQLSVRLTVVLIDKYMYIRGLSKV